MDCFPKIWVENKQQFSKLLTINLISNFKQNLIEDAYKQNQCFNSTHAIFAKYSMKAKANFAKKMTKRLKRVKDVFKNWHELNKQMLKIAYFV